MRALRKVAAFLVGFVLFVAGFLKLMDPVGAGLVVDGYLNWMPLGFLTPLSKAIGVGLALFETLLGAAIITGVWKKAVALVSLVVLGGFTVLTFILWIANPSMDCGCFGQAIHLTHLQSLLKNVVLLALWCAAYLPLSRLENPGKIKYVSFTLTAISVAAFTVWSLLGIPMMDFTPYAPGERLTPEWDEETAEPLTLPFCDASDEYLDSLAFGHAVLIVSAYEPDDLSGERLEDIGALIQEASECGYRPLLLAASAPDEIPWADSALADRTYFADARTLMTLNRSNGGATILRGGQIIRKWAVRSLPGAEKLQEIAAADPTEAAVSENSGPKLKVQGFLLYVFAVMLLL